MGRIRLRRFTAAKWNAVNEILKEGEIGLVLNTNPIQFKIGNGITPWNDLPFAIGDIPQGSYQGAATTAMNPGVPLTKGFWSAVSGNSDVTFTNFGGVVLPANSIGFISWNLTTWNIQSLTFSVADGSITSAKIASTSVTPEKTNFIQSLPVVTSINLFNKATVTPSIKRGKDGVNIADTNVSTSAPIPISSPGTLHRARSQSNNFGFVMYTEYDANGAVIPTGGSDVGASTFTPTVNTVAITVSARKIDLADFMVYKNTTGVITAYVPYAEVIQYTLSSVIKILEASIPAIFRKKTDLLSNADMSTPFRLQSAKIIGTTDTDIVINSTGNQLFDISNTGLNREGYYLNENSGALQVNATYNTFRLIPFGDQTQIVLNKNARSVVFYDAAGVMITDSGMSSPVAGTVFSKTGINVNAAFISGSVAIASWSTLMINYGSVIKTWEAYKAIKKLALDTYAQKATDELKLEILGGVGESLFLLDSITGRPADKKTTDVADGATYSVNTFPYFLKKGLAMSLYADIAAFTGAIEFGKGLNQYRGDWLKIDATNIYWMHYESSVAVRAKFAHSLTFSSFVKISLYVDDMSKCSVILQTLDKYFLTTFDWVYEANYAPFVKTVGQALSNVKINCASKEFRNPVWAIGDSYFGVTSNRWIGVMKNFGFFNFLVNGLAGQGSAAALTDLNKMLNYGTPKYLLWCLGMNDTDGVYQTILNAVIAVCNAKKIILILATIPTIPTRPKEVISNIVRTSGLRYIDFYKAVGTNSAGTWYSGYLDIDGIHPTIKGAQALATQCLVDFPEIMGYGKIDTGAAGGGTGGDL